jgi:hypothetical protein
LPNLRGRVATRVAACRATSVRDFAEIGQISLMPNPVIQKKITINANLKNIQPLEIQAFDISGKQVFQKIIAENNLSWSETLDLSNLSNGIYFFYIRVGDFFTTQKIILAPQ